MYGVIILVFYLSSVNAETINTDMPESSYETNTKLFDFYKTKYDKKYNSDSEEGIAFLNFVDNLKKVKDMNEHTKNSTYYVLDRYADIDTDFMQEHYAVTVNPIAAEPLRNIKADITKELKRAEKEKVLENTELFDLDNADELYETYLKRYKKKVHKSKLHQQIHFLRFVKTLVNVNRNHINGNGNAFLDENADVVQQPQELSY